MRRMLLVVMAFSVFAAPVWADVLPSRRSERTEQTKGIMERTATVGGVATEAQRQVQSLTAEDRAFFAVAPERIQIVGAQDMFSGQASPLWYEWLGGLGFGLIGLGALVYMVNNNEK